MIQKWEALQAETSAAFDKPKAERPAGLAETYNKTGGELIGMLDQISKSLTLLIKLRDPYIDQLFNVKQLAWQVRNEVGDSNTVVSNAVGGLKPAADAVARYQAYLAAGNASWSAIEDVVYGMTLPAYFNDAMKHAKNEFFVPEYTKLRFDVLKAAIAGQPVKMPPAEWVKFSVDKLNTILGVANAALAAVSARAEELKSKTVWQMSIQIIILALVAALTMGVVVLLSRRITVPLGLIQDGMMKVAQGNFNVSLPPLESKDEVGQIVAAQDAA
ncbi:MAG: hypothetical protein B7Y75_03380, partial [Azorhizobium sp. 35-67-5]